MDDIKVGDTVSVSFDGLVDYVNEHWLNVGPHEIKRKDRAVTVTKTEPLVRFGPGDTLRRNGDGSRIIVTDTGWYNLNGLGFHTGGHGDLTSAKYTKIDPAGTYA